MFEFSREDILQTLRRAPNLNSAIKNFLKRQVRPGDTTGRFAKDLRDIMLSKDDDRARLFLDKYLESHSPQLLAIGAYAHAEVVDRLATQIVSTYADDFNATYQSEGESIELKDEGKFDKIMKTACDEITRTLSEAGHENSLFLRAIVLNAVFEQPVLQAGLDRGIL